MRIKRISELSKEEEQASNCLVAPILHESKGINEDKFVPYVLEIITSSNPMNPSGRQKVFATIALYDKDGTMIHHEVYLDTITPNQMKEAEMNIKNNLSSYLKKVIEPKLN